jgi:hypothetical protein
MTVAAPRFRRASAWQVFQITAGALFTPLRIWANNPVEIGDPTGILLWAGLWWLMGWAVWWLILRLGGDRQGATEVGFWFLLGGTSLGPLSQETPGGTLTLLIALLGILAMVYRLRAIKGYQVFSTWAVLVVAILPIAIGVQSAVSRGVPSLHRGPEIRIDEFVIAPDIVLIVADGHGSSSTLEDFGLNSDQYSDDMMRDWGVVRVEDFNSNYTLTHLSLASFFEMDYPVGEGEVVEVSDFEVLLDIIRGENHLVQTLRSQGYRFVMVESGWSGSQCSGSADVCVESSWPDEATSTAIRSSLLRRWSGRLEDAFASGNIHTIDWLRNQLQPYLADEQPDIIFSHLLLPHPPFRLDERCGYYNAPGLGARVMADPFTTTEHLDRRKHAYVLQSLCLYSVISEISPLFGENSMLLVFGDHGPDSQAQLFKAPEDWSSSDIVERFGTLLLVKSSRCGFQAVESLVNLGRELLSCLSNSDIEHLPDRHYIDIESPYGTVGEPLMEVELP